MLYAAGPLTGLWADLIEQGLANDSDAAIHVSDILETIQRSLVLLGNANSLISETRHEIALESVHPSLRERRVCGSQSGPLRKRVQGHVGEESRG